MLRLYFLGLSFLATSCGWSSCSTKKVAVFVNHKKTPSAVMNALQIASITKAPEDISCLFFNTEDIIRNPDQYRDILSECNAWVGPVHAYETKDLLASINLPSPPVFLSFSNNLALLQENVFPLGPSPLLELLHVFEDMRKHCLCRVLVLLSETSLDQVLPFFLNSNLNVSFLFFVYPKEITNELKEDLCRSLKIFSPDAIVAPFGDTVSFECLIEAIGATSSYTNMMPYIAGTSLWGDEFLSDTALQKAFKVKYPQTKKLFEFQSTFQNNFDESPSALAITAYDSLCVALSLVSDPEQISFQTCRGNITLMQPFLGYEIK